MTRLVGIVERVDQSATALSGTDSEGVRPPLRTEGERLAAVVAATRAFMEDATDYDELLHTIAQRIAEGTGDACTIRLLSDDGQQLVAVGAYSQDPELRAAIEMIVGQSVQRKDIGVWRSVIEEGRPLRIPIQPGAPLPTDATRDQLAFIERWPVGEVMLVPLVAHRRTLGGISLVRYRNPTPFTDAEQSYMQDLAGRAALAIDNARLYRDAQRLNVHLETRVMERTAALEDAVAHAQGVLEAAPYGIVAIDADGRIRLVNRQTEVIFGYDRSELIGEPVEKLMPASLRDVHPGHRQQYMKNPETRSMGAGLSLSGLRKDGTEFPIDIALSSMETADGLLAYAAVRDITDRVEVETKQRMLTEELHQARLAQSERLESVGQLAGGIAHDFNNLLAVILNYASFVHGELKENDPIRLDVEEIRRAAERAAILTKQLLIFSRREVTKPELLDLNAIVVDLEKFLRRAIGEHVEFVSRLTPALPSIRADRGQIEQVFVNLAVNARDAMPQGGRLLVETVETELDREYEVLHPGVTPGRYVRLTVSDTGTGMPPDVVARAFEPFFTTKEKGRGSGLGLATVYGIVRQSGGDISIYSEVGHGTSIRVHFPAVAGTAASVAPQLTAKLTGGKGETILVVEDEASMRAVARRILSRHGYEVLEAASPKEALGIVSGHAGKIDLVLSDVVMPEMSGKELVGHIRAARPHIRVLYISGYPQGLFGPEGAAEKGVALLEKPFTETSLLVRLREILDAASDA